MALTSASPKSIPASKTLQVAVQASPVPAPPEFTLSATDTTITASIVDGKGAASFEIRLENGTAVSGLVLSGQTAEQTYSVQVRGLNSEGQPGSWSVAQSITTAAASTGGDGTAVDVVEPSAEYFSDDFASGDWNKQRPGGGDFWVSNQFGSIVTMSPDGHPTVIYNGSSIYNELVGDSRDWTAKVGDNCLRVRYNTGQHDNSKQQWRIQTADAMTEIHVAFWLRVPVNFDKSDGNNKLFWMWMDGRSDEGSGSTVGMEYRGSPGAYWYTKVGAGDYQVVGGDQGSTTWIVTPDDRGRWMRIIIGAKVESSPGASDGWMKVWRRWADESAFTNTHASLNQPIKLPDDPAAPQGFVECEILGYPNGPFNADTEFLVDGVRVSPTPLVPAGTEGL